MIQLALSRLFKGSMVYGIGAILQRFIGLFLLPFYTKELTPVDYGVVALITLLSVAIGGLFSLGTGNSMGLLYYREIVQTKRYTIIWSTFFLLLFNCAFWYSILYTIAPYISDLMFQSNQYAYLIRLSFLGTVIGTIADPFLAYLRMEQLAKKYVLITLLSSLISISISIYLVLFLNLGVTGVILSGLFGQILMFISIYISVGRQIPFGLNISLFSNLIRIGFPSIFGLFAFMIIDYADRQMIERIAGLSALGIYSLGYSFGMVIMIAVNAFATAWPPFFMSYINNRGQAKNIFSRVLTYYVFGFGLLSVLFFFIAQPVIFIMTAPDFHQGWTVVGLVAVSYALKGCYLIVLPGIYFENKLHLQSSIEWAAAIINVGLNLLFIPLYGFFGAALATFVSYLTLPIFAWFAARHYLSVDYDWLRLTKSVILSGVTCISIFFISSKLAFELAAIFLNLAFIILFLLLTFRFLLNRSERKWIKSKLSFKKI
jgi:O-antigen/teichoic acid export membrane protein